MERSATRRCQTHFGPRPASPSTNGETKPKQWLVDFELACQLGGARGDDRSIICQLLLFLSDTTCRWLEELPANQIHDWTDLVQVFEGNFNGTYIRPGNTWGLSKCKQKSGETLREYARQVQAEISKCKQRTEKSASASSALSSRTSPTTTSSCPLSQAPRTKTWYGNWVEIGLRPSTN